MKTDHVERIAYRPEEVAAALGVGRTHVFRLIADGELDSVLCGRARLIPVRSVTEYLDRLRAAATDD